MSARPRPVTATFKPPCMAPPVGVRERNYSLSSGSSTASLVSILDHDSYESLGSDYEDSPVKTPKQKSKIGTRERASMLTTDTQDSVTTHTATTERHTDTQTESHQPQDHGDNNNHVASWEKWLIKKTKDDRKQQRREASLKQKQEEEEAKKKAEEAEKAKKGEEKYQEWLEKKTLETKLRQKSATRQKKTKEEIEEEKKREIDEKAQQKYQDWLNQKKTVAQEKKKEEKENKKQEEEKKKVREEKCDEAFNSWCKNAKRRPKSACSSYGYTSGKLTGYYDASAPSPPAYYNPIPWQPIAIPRQKTEKKRPKSKYRWNPDKYL